LRGHLPSLLRTGLSGRNACRRGCPEAGSAVGRRRRGRRAGLRRPPRRTVGPDRTRRQRGPGVAGPWPAFGCTTGYSGPAGARHLPCRPPRLLVPT